MCLSNFHNFYKYDLNDDDTECLKFLLSDFLRNWDIFQNDSGRRIQDFVFLLLINGFSENETLNIIIESLFYIPRLDILYECSVPIDSYKTSPFGKLICSKRLFLFKIFNEFEERDFKTLLNNFCRAYCKSFNLIINEQSILKKLNMILKLCIKDPDIFNHFQLYFLNYGNNRTEKLVESFKDFEELQISPSEQLWEKITEDEKHCLDENYYLALEKGDEVSTPNFVYSAEGRVKMLKYKHDEFYPYPESDRVKSVCLIINIKNYEHYPMKGSERDVANIYKTFGKLHFTIQKYENLNKNEMISVAKTYSKIEASKSGSMLVCFILAHGCKDCIYDINEELVSIREFSLIFNAKNCEAYKNKPKLFFIQACQGDRFHEGIPESGIQSSQISLTQENLHLLKPPIKQYKNSDIIPEEADFIYGMSTVADYVAFRSTKKGSWYISELCKRVNKEAQTNDIISILTNVIHDVSMKTHMNACQLPSVMFTSRKKCFLTKQII
uniref:Caspase-8 n=1 Tax=Schmidtea mediterranea TaxID=79327 RepID=U5QER6_SCHMD|nr:caspase-8 [Schmidtea mediterranea]